LRYLHALREHWLLVLVTVAVAVGAAATYSLTAQKRYEAEADVLVTPLSGSDDTFIGIPGLLRETSVPNSAILTAARLVKTPAVAREARRRLGSSESTQTLLDHVEAKPLSQSSIVAVVGKASTRARAADIANAFGESLVARRTADFQRGLTAVRSRLQAELQTIPASLRTTPEAAAIQQRLAQLGSVIDAQDPTVEVSSRAEPPRSQTWPRPALSIAVALLAALLLGSGAAIGSELISPRITREDDLVVDHGLPVLARVPRLSAKNVRAYLTGKGDLPPHVWEAYRTLRANLAVAGPDGGPPRSILVTSAQANEGKTMTAVNLAVTAARAGAHVVLVDGDLRKPRVATAFGLPGGRHGFVRMLKGEAGAKEALMPAPGQERLALLLSTWEHTGVVDLLEPRRVARVIDELMQTADLVVIDSPPVTEVADALSLADASDAVVLAIRLGKGRRDRLEDLRRMLARRGIYPTGFVVTNRKSSRGGGYYYASAEEEEPKPRKDRRRARRRERERERPTVVGADDSIGW